MRPPSFDEVDSNRTFRNDAAVLDIRAFQLSRSPRQVHHNAFWSMSLNGPEFDIQIDHTIVATETGPKVGSNERQVRPLFE